MSEDSRCLYCLESGRPSNVEHIAPAGLGSHADIVLPAGAVCESCNNWLGRQVDEALVHLFEVLLIRGVFRIRDREGRTVDRLELSNGPMNSTGTGEVLNVVVNSEHLEERDCKTLLVTLVSKRRHSGAQWRRVTRAVLKIGLGLTYLQYGASIALGRDFDPVRAANAASHMRGTS